MPSQSEVRARRTGHRLHAIVHLNNLLMTLAAMHSSKSTGTCQWALRLELRQLPSSTWNVLVASPHERAWREALRGITDPARFTTELYQAYVAGKPRLSGARAALEQLGIFQCGRTGGGLR